MKSPETGVLRIGSGNVYVGNREPIKAIGIAVATRSHSWSWSEGNNLTRHMQNPVVTRGMHPLLATGFADPKDANDCSMLVSKRVKVVHHSATKVCDDVPGSKVGHARTYGMVAYEAPMLAAGNGVVPTICHVGIHPNWVQGFKTGGSRVVDEYIESNENLDAMLTFAEQMGWLPVVSGDFNLRRNAERPYLTTYDIFAKHRLAVKMEGIDGMAYDRRLVLADWTLIPKSRTKSDHDFWTVADFTRRGAAKK